MLTRRTLGLSAGAGLILSGGVARATGADTVMTRHGPVRGQRDGDVHWFKGIPYGADTAARRFQPPMPPTPWRHSPPGMAFGRAAPQRGDEPDQGEDCLCLNVWTPGLDGERRPVIVYVHGGAYATGSGSSPLTDGTRLARRHGLVVVTVNHRLNALGYASLGRIAAAHGVVGFEDSDNAGQLDLVLALQWVRDHIAAFGGDPGRVTLMGQSGGGAKIATLMAMPAADGLFHRVVTMSGQQVTASGPLNATRRAEVWLETLGVSPDRLTDLHALPVQRLIEATAAIDPILGGSLYFGPVLDGRSLDRHPFWPDAPHRSAHIPMMIGNTREETLAFLGNDPANAGLTWDDLPRRLTPQQMRIDVAPEDVVAWYRARYPQMSPDEVLIRATTAARSWRAAVIEAEARATAGTPAFVYQLDWPARLPNGRTGAFHTSDIALMFDTLDTPGSGAIGPEAQGLADVMGRTLAAFAATGDPNHAGLPLWTPYSIERRETMIWDQPPRMQDDPRGDERRFFGRIPYVQPGT
ncbi:carboxylesterase/lipase family protein [Brevundimonas sp.]|uniref:carboxylesterase/lipase family protein n=1 Tax=Brevundimonas sp. TaxID=1871086 RepID=UPI002AB8F239|nr:carboxylesterase/lipase family protein [Brevundimonas sp.]MDZ4363747.1 carboxylesterase/lipase family protein [Brevundimonas sp.]